MPYINAFIEAPVTWGPKETDLRRENPYTGNPVIAIIIVGPVSGNPDITINRAWRLYIYRYWRRRETHGNSDGHAEL
jgi:hypothetical protein